VRSSGATEQLATVSRKLLEDTLQHGFEMRRESAGVSQSDELIHIVANPCQLTSDLAVGSGNLPRPFLPQASPAEES
jgi:hypothetical protein